MAIISGIYVILHVKSGKIYLGQAQNIRARWRCHRSDLKLGKHGNRHLQAAWNKYGEKAFQFKILERCSIDQLDEREQHYLDVYIPKGICYNIAIDATVPWRGRHLSDAHKLQISETHKGKFVSEKTRQKLREINTGRKHSPETLQKLSEAHKGSRTPLSDETRRKISESEKGKIVSEETRRKLSESHKGKIPWNKGKFKKKSINKGDENMPTPLFVIRALQEVMDSGLTDLLDRDAVEMTVWNQRAAEWLNKCSNAQYVEALRDMDAADSDDFLEDLMDTQVDED